MNIEALAREADLECSDGVEYPIRAGTFLASLQELERFAALVLEESAKACALERLEYVLDRLDERYNNAVDDCAATIRALAAQPRVDL